MRSLCINHFSLLDVGVTFCHNHYMNCWEMSKNVWIRDLLSHWILVCCRHGTRSKTTKPRTSRWHVTIQTDLICKRKNVSWTTVWFITWGCKSNSAAENEKKKKHYTCRTCWMRVKPETGTDSPLFTRRANKSWPNQTVNYNYCPPYWSESI